MNNRLLTRWTGLLLAVALVVSAGLLTVWAEDSGDGINTPDDLLRTEGEIDIQGSSDGDNDIAGGGESNIDAVLPQSEVMMSMGMAAAGDTGTFFGFGDGSLADPYTTDVVLPAGTYELYPDHIKEAGGGTPVYFSDTANLVFTDVAKNEHVTLILCGSVELAAITVLDIVTSVERGSLSIVSDGGSRDLKLAGSYNPFTGLANGRLSAGRIKVGEDVSLSVAAPTAGGYAIYTNGGELIAFEVEQGASVEAHGLLVDADFFFSPTTGGGAVLPAIVEVKGQLDIDGGGLAAAICLEGKINVANGAVVRVQGAAVGLLIDYQWRVFPTYAESIIEGILEIDQAEQGLVVVHPNNRIEVKSTGRIAVTGQYDAIRSVDRITIDGGVVHVEAQGRKDNSAAILGDVISVVNGGILVEKYTSPTEIAQATTKSFRPYAGTHGARGANMYNARHYSWGYDFGGVSTPILLDDNGLHITDTVVGTTLTGERTGHVDFEPILLDATSTHRLVLPADLEAGIYDDRIPNTGGEDGGTASGDRTTTSRTRPSTPPPADTAAVVVPAVPEAQPAAEAPTLEAVEENTPVETLPNTGFAGGQSGLAPLVLTGALVVGAMRLQRRRAA